MCRTGRWSGPDRRAGRSCERHGFGHSPTYQHFQEGRLVPLAITSDKRFDILPNLPTVNETVPGSRP
jgi:hypothetical protein